MTDQKNEYSSWSKTMAETNCSSKINNFLILKINKLIDVQLKEFVVNVNLIKSYQLSVCVRFYRSEIFLFQFSVCILSMLVIFFSILNEGKKKFLVLVIIMTSKFIENHSNLVGALVYLISNFLNFEGFISKRKWKGLKWKKSKQEKSIA